MNVFQIKLCSSKFQQQKMYKMYSHFQNLVEMFCRLHFFYVKLVKLNINLLYCFIVTDYRDEVTEVGVEDWERGCWGDVSWF